MRTIVEDSAHVRGARRRGTAARYRFIPPQTGKFPAKDA